MGCRRSALVPSRLWIVCLFSSLLAAQTMPPAGKVTLLRAGRVLEVRTATYLTDQGILIEAGNIKQVGPFVELQKQAPKGAIQIDLSKANLWGGALLLLAGSISFVGIGITASVLPLLFPERGEQMTHVFIALLLLVSGVYYPVTVLPEFLQKLAVFSPATYVLDGSRKALLEGTSTLQLWPYVWPVLVIGIILIPLGLWVFGQAEK